MITQRHGFKSFVLLLAAIFMLSTWIGSTPRTAYALDTSVLTYGAVGNGTTNDRAAIQAAIDAVSAAGGGTVNLPGGYTFLTGDITLKNNVTLNINTNAILKQSQVIADYAHSQTFGRLKTGAIAFNAWADYNYPLIFAGTGTHDIAITGAGKIQMTNTGNDSTSIIIHAIGFSEVSNFTISNITIDNASMYNMAIRQSDHGVISGVTTTNPASLNSDGVSLANSQFIRVHDNNLTTGDDGIYVWASYNDPRGGTWWSTAIPEPSHDIEIDHNYVNDTCAGGCNGFVFINWTGGAPDQSQVEISKVNVHDNTFIATRPIGALTSDVYTSGPKTPLKSITFKNNTLTAVPNTGAEVHSSFADLPMTDFSGDGDFAGITSSTALVNTNFDSAGTSSSTYKGASFWSTEGDSGASNAAVSQPGGYWGYIKSFDLGYASIYQGVHLTPGTYTFSGSVQSSGASIRMFAIQASSGTVMQSSPFTNTSWASKSISFTVATAGTYRVGIDSTGSGTSSSSYGRIDSASLTAGATPTPTPTPTPSPTPTPTPSNGPTTILTSETPAGYDDAFPYELGTKFYAAVNGTVSKVRIYTNSTEGGSHTVRIWNAGTSSVVAGPYTWTITSGTQGWKEYTLPTALSISANTDYIVSVSNSSDKWYSYTSGGYNAPINNGYLRTYTGSGTYTATLGAMPTTQFGNANYFRDIVFTASGTSTPTPTPTPTATPTPTPTATPTPSAGPVSIFTSQTPAAYYNDTQYELGTKFYSTVNGTVSKVRIYTNATESGSHSVRIWNASTSAVVAGPYTWTITSGTAGWKEFTLPASLSITANTDYIVSVSNSTDNWYAASSGGFSSPVNNGYLHTYTGSGVYSTTLGSMPTSQYGNNNYFRDVVFTP